MKPEVLMTQVIFAGMLESEVNHIGDIHKAAAICGVNARTIKNWLTGTGKPVLATRYGAIKLLSEHRVKTQ